MASSGSVTCERFRSNLQQIRDQAPRRYPYLAEEFRYLDQVPYSHRSAKIRSFYFSEFKFYKHLGSCLNSFLARRRASSRRSFRINLVLREGDHLVLIRFCHTGSSLITVIYWYILHPYAYNTTPKQRWKVYIRSSQPCVVSSSNQLEHSASGPPSFSYCSQQ
jgi:hypothetical protein